MAEREQIENPKETAKPRTRVQSKLEVGAVDDPSELEADRVAAEVMDTIARMSSDEMSGDVQRRSVDGPSTKIRRRADDGAGGEVPADVEADIRGAGPGQALDSTLRPKMEAAFGTDFEGVRVHPDSDLAPKIGAQAFTQGGDIHFAPGKYEPSAAGGQELIAHELTHVVQQGAAVTRSVIRRDVGEEQKEDPAAEQAARNEAADKAMGKGEPEGEKSWGDQATESKTESSTFDGTTEKTSETSTAFLVGAGASLKVLEGASGADIDHAVEFLARGGVFGEAEKQAAWTRGGISAEASAKASGGVGAELDLKAGLTINKSVLAALEATVSASVKVGAGADLEAVVKGECGPISAELKAKLSVFAGAAAEAKGQVNVGLLKTGVSGEASAFAGAKAEGSAEASVDIGVAKLEGALSAGASAGASAAAKGEFSIGLEGLTIAGEAEAFAGVKAEAKASGGLSLAGHKIFSAEARVEVSAGVGGKVGGEISFQHGKLKISGDLAATLGIGAGVGLSVEIDFVALAKAIEQIIVDAFFSKKEEIERRSPGAERVPIVDQAKAAQMRQFGYDSIFKDFAAYGAKKSKQGKSGIKRERVQQILDKRYGVLKDAYAFEETDAGVNRAATEAFGSQLKEIYIQAGQIRSFAAAKKEGQAERERAEFEKNLGRGK